MISGTVSACLVVYNEAHRIADTLQALRPWVDEIVVVDQMSTDNTALICRRYADVFRQDEHHGFCEASRQLAHDVSSGEWILCMHADEKMTRDLQDDLYDLIADPHVDGYSFKWTLTIGNEEFAKGPEYRLYRRDAVCYLNELHTEPQPRGRMMLYSKPAFHEYKSMQEQLEDEARYLSVINSDPRDEGWKQCRRGLNWYTQHIMDILKGNV